MQTQSKTIQVNIETETRNTNEYVWKWIITTDTEKKKTSERSGEVKQFIDGTYSGLLRGLWDEIGVAKDKTNYEQLIEYGRN